MLAFAYSTINWGETPDMAAMLSEIGAEGWRAVEVFAQPLNWLGPHTDLIAQLRENRLRAATFFGGVEIPGDAGQPVRHRRRIDYAAATGADTYGIAGGGRRRQSAPTADEFRALAGLLEDLAAYGADRGVEVAYHPHVGTTIETEEETDRLLDATHLLRLCLDVSHVALVGENPVRQLRRYRERLGYVHLKDWGRGNFTELGRGTIGMDFPEILGELEAWDFPGWVVVEQSRSDVSPAASLAINTAYLRDRGYAFGELPAGRH
jgi:inosose dehydratase